jgi:DNA-binding LacI/PurR family transcriptional regulator
MVDALAADGTREAIALAAWEQSGGARQELLMVPGNARLDGGRVALETVLAARPRPTALIAASDMAAIGVIQGADEQGLRIPQFLSVVGIGDIASASLVNPALTTVALPRREVGAAAAQRALDLLEGEEQARETAPAWLPTSLVVRRSTGAPPRM